MTRRAPVLAGLIAAAAVCLPGATWPADGVVRWIAAGGGGLPVRNQVSIEQDIGLAGEVLGPGGLTLFAAGPGTQGVQVEAARRPGDPLLRQLGDLFDPRAGRDATYRRTRIDAAGPSTADDVVAALDGAFDQGDQTLLVYLAGHGELGNKPRLNAIELWGQTALSVADLAAVLDSSPGRRAVRLVVTSCYSGGFAELVFADADPAHGAAGTPRCGFFSTAWDLEASGCDPNPDRRRQEGYGIHFLNALRGRDRDGKPLPADVLDLDRDGRISLLEAHTRVRVASAAPDVPTTTSERWLREVGRPDGPFAERPTLEEDAVVATLGRRLGLSGREDAARLVLEELERRIDTVQDRIDDAEAKEDNGYRATAAELLAEWPVLDDPWHPDFGRTVKRSRKAIAARLKGSPHYAAFVAASRARGEMELALADLRGRAAPLERLVRALDNRLLARSLHAKGGDDLATYERLLACERGVP